MYICTWWNLSLGIPGNQPHPLYETLLALTTLTWQGVQVFLTAYDGNPLNGNSLLAEAQINFTTENTQLGVQTPPITYTGPRGDSNITTTFVVVCTEYWYGRDCNVWCQNDNCMCDLPVPCHNNCLGVVCGVNRHCVDGVDVYVCTCDRGFTGRWCETNTDECEGVNCSGNGRCFDGVDSFYCSCDSGYAGTLCEIAITDSDLGRVVTQISPHNLGNSYIHIDPVAIYTGILCEIASSCSSFLGRAKYQCLDTSKVWMFELREGSSNQISENKLESWHFKPIL